MARIRLARAEEEASKNEHRLHARISELERKNALLAAESKRNYERGVQQATAVYTEVIRGYVAENVNLRELVRWMYDRMDESCAVQHPYAPAPISYDLLHDRIEKRDRLSDEVPSDIGSLKALVVVKQPDGSVIMMEGMADTFSVEMDNEWFVSESGAIGPLAMPGRTASVHFYDVTIKESRR